MFETFAATMQLVLFIEGVVRPRESSAAKTRDARDEGGSPRRKMEFPAFE